MMDDDVDISYIPKSGHLTDDLRLRIQKILIEDRAPSSTVVRGFVTYAFCVDPINEEVNLYVIAGGDHRPHDDVVIEGMRVLSGE
jgi:hypothetical protein